MFILLMVPFLINARDVTIRGFIQTCSIDSVTEELPFANISLLQSCDSLFIKGCTSGSDGSFKLSFTPKSSDGYILRASYTGLCSKILPIALTSEEINVGTITLYNSIELDEIVVTATPIELIQRGDTTIINAEAYNLPEGAFLEELVRRVPGLEYDRQSKALTYNGQHLTGININGEPYFTGNNSIALQNLPAEVIDKIKIYNKQSELEKFMGISSGEDNYILDLQTKKKFNGTLMTSIEAGAGNEHKQIVDLISNYFRQNGDNLSLIARRDNRNHTTDYKHNIDNTAALNFNKKFKSDFSLNGSFTYNGRKAGTESASYTEEYLITDNRYRHSEGFNISDSHNLTSHIGINWKIDAMTMVSATVTTGYNRLNTSNETTQALFSEKPQLDLIHPFDYDNTITTNSIINKIEMASALKSTQNQFSAQGELVRLINKRGASVSLSGSYAINNGDADNNTISSTTYYLLHDEAGADSLLYRNQYRSTPTKIRNTSGGLAFTYPFNSKTHLQFAYKLKSDINTNRTSTFDIYPDNASKIFVDSLSNSSLSNTLGHEFALRFNYVSKSLKIETSLTVCPEHRRLDNKTGASSADIVVNSTNYSPRLTVRWQSGKSTLNLTYNGASRQPSLTDLIVPTDNSDPLNIVKGNPTLHPAYRQSLRLEWRNTKLGLTTIFEGNNEYNSITRAIEYNPETGGRTSYPVNINGNYSLRGNIRYQKRMRMFNATISVRTSKNHSISLLNERQKSDPDENITDSYNTASDLRLGYNPVWGSIELNGAWAWRKSVNHLRDTKTHIRDYSFGANIFANLPYDFSLTSSFSCELRNGTYIESHRDDKYLWNVQVCKNFLKSKTLELSVAWIDILNQRKNIAISSSSYGYSETYTNQIGGYFLVSLKFRFNKTL